MPYLRLYARDLPIQEKRVLAQKLIEITLRTFKLRAHQRYQTSVQFITTSHASEVDGLQGTIPRGADFTLEVIGHNLTEEKKRAFSEEAALCSLPWRVEDWDIELSACWESGRSHCNRWRFSSMSSTRR